MKLLSKLGKFLMPTQTVDDLFHLPSQYLFQPYIPERLLYPCFTERGEALESLVKAGDKVEIGQVIANDVKGQSPVHCALAGKVLAVEPRVLLHPDKLQGMTIEVAVDTSLVVETKVVELSSTLEFSAAFLKLLETTIDSPTQQSWLQRIEQAGVIGMGGAGFPSSKKILAAKSQLNSLLVKCFYANKRGWCDQQTLWGSCNL